MTQYAAIRALTGKCENMVAEFDKRRKYMMQRLRQMGLQFIEPDGAFYIMVKTDISAEELLQKAHIAVVPGAAFGAPGYIRVSYTVSMQDIKEGLDRLEKFLTN